jgi:hypothetical protein
MDFVTDHLTRHHQWEAVEILAPCLASDSPMRHVPHYVAATRIQPCCNRRQHASTGTPHACHSHGCPSARNTRELGRHPPRKSTQYSKPGGRRTVDCKPRLGPSRWQTLGR